jgi:hypothetical protein
MPLPTTGALKFSDINTELGRSSGATISLDAAEGGSYGAINITSPDKPNGSRPNTMSEWRGYNHENNKFFYSTNATCFSLANLTCYLSSVPIVVNTTIMYVVSGTSMVTIASGNYYIEVPDQIGTISVNSSGVITSFTEC